MIRFDDVIKPYIDKSDVLDSLCHYCKSRCSGILKCAQWYSISNLPEVMVTVRTQTFIKSEGDCNG